MTLTEAAKHRGVDPSALRHAIRRGRLEATRGDKGWLVTITALRRYDRLQGPRPEGFITASEAARRLGRSRQRVHQMIAAGQLPARRTKEGRVLIPESAVKNGKEPA
jgi:excisionase family DNA binding protein